MDTLASEVEYARSLWAQTRGLIGADTVTPGYALVFPGVSGRVPVHTFGVRTSLGVVWVRDGQAVRVSVLRPWRGVAVARADTLIEAAPVTVAPVDAGDTVVVEPERILYEPA